MVELKSGTPFNRTSLELKHENSKVAQNPSTTAFNRTSLELKLITPVLSSAVQLRF